MLDKDSCPEVKENNKKTRVQIIDFKYAESSFAEVTVKASLNA